MDVIHTNKYVTDSGELRALEITVADENGRVHHVYYIVEDGEPNRWSHHAPDEAGELELSSMNVIDVANEEAERQVSNQ